MSKYFLTFKSSKYTISRSMRDNSSVRTPIASSSPEDGLPLIDMHQLVPCNTNGSLESYQKAHPYKESGAWTKEGWFDHILEQWQQGAIRVPLNELYTFTNGVSPQDKPLTGLFSAVSEWEVSLLDDGQELPRIVKGGVIVTKIIQSMANGMGLGGTIIGMSSDIPYITITPQNWEQITGNWQPIPPITPPHPRSTRRRNRDNESPLPF